MLLLALGLAWRTLEGGHISHIKEEAKKPEDAVKNIIALINSNPNKCYYLIFIICELLQVILISCIFALAVMKLDLTSMSDALELPFNYVMHENVRTDRQILRFPRKVAFFIQVYGTSGTQQILDALCIVGNQIYIEAAHITLFFLTFAMLITSILNFFYVWGNIHCLTYAKFDVKKKQPTKDMQLSSNQKLTLCLLYHNVPANIYVDVVKEMLKDGSSDSEQSTVADNIKQKSKKNEPKSAFFPYLPLNQCDPLK